MLRYQREVTPTKRGARWESIRLDAMLNMAELPLDMPVARIAPDDFNAWRAARLRSVSAGTVLREFGILSAVFETARRAGMRAGELCGLQWSRVHADYCELPVTKTLPRQVPITPKAARLIRNMRGFDAVRVFGVDARTLDALFRRARANAGLAGFTFHDSRHTAATWLALRINVLDLCKMFGWTDPKRAMTYYNPTASEIARRIG